MVGRIRTDDNEAWIGRPAGTLRPLRKPDPRLIGFALEALEIEDRWSVAMVGDQYLTDIAAANLAGIRSIKVPTLGWDTSPLAVRVLQRLDSALSVITGAVRHAP